MDPLSRPDFNRICRCCLFSQEQEMVLLNAWLLEIYCAITSLQFNMEDMLPKLICQQCLTKMKLIKDFAEVCIESNKRLAIIKHEAVSTIKVEEDTFEIKTESDIETLTENCVNEIDKNVKKELLTSDNGCRKTTNNKKPILVPNGFKEKAKQPPTKLTIVKRNKNTELIKIVKRFACDKCDMKFAAPSFLTKHKLAHLKRETNTCFTCKTKFATKELRNKHYEDSATCQPQKFACEVCDKSFKQKHLLIRHSNVHLEERGFVCNECGKAFKHVSNLKWHQRVHINKNEKMKHFCAFCGKGFEQPCLLKLHEETHTNTGSYDCNKCDKNFTSKLAFKRHKYHCDKKVFLCPECGRTLNTKEALKVHIRTHTGEKPYKCPHCPKLFSQPAGLNSHILVHSDTRSYACDLCDKTFRHSASLKGHKISHSGAKSYQCNICERKLVSAVNLKLHMSIHTGDRPIKCPHCGEGFAHYKDRRIHVKQIHGVSTSKEASNEHENENT